MIKKSTLIRSYAVIVLSAMLLVWSLCTLSFIRINAVGFDELNAPEVFLKQETSKTCTLSSATMMVRRAAMLSGNKNWKNITESAMRKKAWYEGSGLLWEFTYEGIKVSHGYLSGNHTEVLKKMLKEHPEGIVAYHFNSSGSVQHAILLTDYTDGVFYCADPANNASKGRIPISQATKVTINNIVAYWYVSSPKCEISEPPKSPDKTEVNDVLVPDVVLPDTDKDEPAKKFEGVLLNKYGAVLAVGDTVKLECSVITEKETESEVKWSVDNPDVAKVDENGNVTALSVGNTVINVFADNGLSALCKIMVNEDGYIPGDSNLDGTVDSSDATLALQYYSGTISEDRDFSFFAADVDGDRLCSVTDATLILQYFAGIVGEF